MKAEAGADQDGPGLPERLLIAVEGRAAVLVPVSVLSTALVLHVTRSPVQALLAGGLSFYVLAALTVARALRRGLPADRQRSRCGEVRRHGAHSSLPSASL